MSDLRAFLDSAGWGDAACEPLTGDASARKYFRLRKSDRSAILMDASRVLDSVAPFIRIGEHLRHLGFSAPEIFSRDEAAGLLLLEDFGDATFAQLLEKSERRVPLLTLQWGISVSLLTLRCEEVRTTFHTCHGFSGRAAPASASRS